MKRIFSISKEKLEKIHNKYKSFCIDDGGDFRYPTHYLINNILYTLAYNKLFCCLTISYTPTNMFWKINGNIIGNKKDITIEEEDKLIERDGQYE